MPSSDFTYNYSPPSYSTLPCRRTTKLQRQILARYPPNHRLSGCQQSNNNDEIEEFFAGFEDEDDTILFSILEETEEVQYNNDYIDDDACLVLQSSFEAVLVEDDGDNNHDVMPSIRKENSSFGCSVSTCSITSYSDDTISIGSTSTNLSGRVFVVEEEKMEKRMEFYSMPNDNSNNNNRRRETNKQSHHIITSPNQTTTKLKRTRSRLQRQLSSKFLKRNKQFNSSKSREVQDFFTTKGIEIVLVEEEDENEGHTMPSSTSSDRRRRHEVIDDEKVVRNGFYYDTYYVSSRSRTITGQ